MKPYWASFAAAALLCGASVLGQNPALINPVAPAGAAAAAQPAAPLSLDQTLDMLDQRGKSLSSFIADVRMTERDESTQLEDTLIGKVWFQKLPDGDARIHVLFTQRQDGKVLRPEVHEYLLEKGWLTERDYDKKIQIRRQIMKEGQKMDLLKLDGGPLPLPIGQKKEDVKKLFEASKEKLTADDQLSTGEKVPPDIVHILLKPRAKTPMENQFKTVDVFVDPKTQMPLKVDTLDKKEVKSRSTELKDVKVNEKLTDTDFTLPKLTREQDWNIRPDERLAN